MSTTATLLVSLRPALTWARGRLATMHRPSVASRVMRALAMEPCRLPMPVPIPVPRRIPRARAIASLALASGIAVAALPRTSAAWHESEFEFAADGRLVDVQVHVEGQGIAPLFTAPGRFDRHYFQAFKGRNYSLVVRNNSGRRVGVLIAVDGLNVINGEKSALARNEAMYVLDPYERAAIRGWRTSLDQVRRFVFVDEERSYAERTGQANGNMGWIRVLTFRERRPFWEGYGKIRGRDDEILPYGSRQELNREQGPAPDVDQEQAPAPERRELQKSAPRAQGGELAPGAPEESRLYSDQRGNDSPQSAPGTGWGERQWDHVNRTWFVAEAWPVDRITLRYEYAAGLRALGIFPARYGRDRLWEREHGELGFARPPQW